MSYPIAVVKKLLTDNGCEKFRDIDGFEIYIHEGVTIIQLPKVKEIDFAILEVIAIDQLRISNWEFDYWLGENTING